MAVLCQCKKDKGKSVPQCAFYRRSTHNAVEGLQRDLIHLPQAPLNLQMSSCSARTAVFIWKINIFAED